MTAIGDASMHGTDESFPVNNPIQLSSYEVVNIDVQSKGFIGYL